jgi:hypothetical protein
MAGRSLPLDGRAADERARPGAAPGTWSAGEPRGAGGLRLKTDSDGQRTALGGPGLAVAPDLDGVHGGVLASAQADAAGKEVDCLPKYAWEKGAEKETWGK